MKLKLALVTAAKLLVKSTPHKTNAVESVAVTQNTEPVWDNILCALCIRKLPFPDRSPRVTEDGSILMNCMTHCKHVDGSDLSSGYVRKEGRAPNRSLEASLMRPAETGEHPRTALPSNEFPAVRSLLAKVPRARPDPMPLNIPSFAPRGEVGSRSGRRRRERSLGVRAQVRVRSWATRTKVVWARDRNVTHLGIVKHYGAEKDIVLPRR